jgi:Spy/CpxP family protein refolding chaperone
MKRSHKTAAGIVAALSLGVAVAAFAQPGPMGDGNGPHGKAGMQHGKMGGMQHGAMGQGAAGAGVGHSLMTPEERTALQEKMRNAKTPEERQKLAQATRDEMQKRAKEKGVTPATTEQHQH